MAAIVMQMRKSRQLIIVRMDIAYNVQLVEFPYPLKKRCN